MLRTLTAFTALVACLTLAAPAAAQVPAAPVLQAGAVGQTVSATWTAVPGALSYRAEVGVTPTAVVNAQEVGPVTSFTLPNVPQGTYYLRVLARNASGLSAPSNVVVVTVTSTQGPPSPPTGMQASVSGTTVTFSAAPPAGATGLLLSAGVLPGQALVVLPVSLSGQIVVPNVPPGVYYARMHAANAGGISGPSNEVTVVVSQSICTAPAAPVVTAQVSGQTVALSWNAVSGAVGYRLDVSATPGGAPMISQPLPASQLGLANPATPAGTYYVRVVAGNACGQTATSAEVTVTVSAPTGGYRTPNPPGPTPPNYLPLPNRYAVVQELARQYPNEFRNSCVEHGGNNTFLYRLVQRLRQEDTRWGLNWKRARVGDMSQDVVNYNYGSDPDEGTYNTYVVDVIGGHCGSNPNPAWIDVTVMFSTGARWTLQPYLNAGYR
jgi:hypothetical protein